MYLPVVESCILLRGLQVERKSGAVDKPNILIKRERDLCLYFFCRFNKTITNRKKKRTYSSAQNKIKVTTPFLEIPTAHKAILVIINLRINIQ